MYCISVLLFVQILVIVQTKIPKYCLALAPMAARVTNYVYCEFHFTNFYCIQISMQLYHHRSVICFKGKPTQTSCSFCYRCCFAQTAACITSTRHRLKSDEGSLWPTSVICLPVSSATTSSSSTSLQSTTMCTSVAGRLR